jgi:hypothetical protein
MNDILPFSRSGASSGALVPRAVQRQLEAVQARGLVAQEALGQLENLIAEAGQGFARQAYLHEQLIMAAPLCDQGLAQLRQAHVALALRIIQAGL